MNPTNRKPTTLGFIAFLLPLAGFGFLGAALFYAIAAIAAPTLELFSLFGFNFLVDTVIGLVLIFLPRLFARREASSV